MGPCQGTLERREGWSGLREAGDLEDTRGPWEPSVRNSPGSPTLGPGVLTCNVMVVPLLLTRMLVLYI